MRRIRLPSALLAAAVAAAVTAAPLAAQSELIALDKVHQLLSGGQARTAANTLRQVSVEFRNEIGRCRDEALGAQLMELEPRVDRLADRIARGEVGTAAQLDADFAVIDRLLAVNHIQLAQTGWGLRRFGRLEGVANDLLAAADYATRAARWAHAAPAPEVQAAIDGARAAATALRASLQAPPAETGAAIEALAAALKGPAK